MGMGGSSRLRRDLAITTAGAPTSCYRCAVSDERGVTCPRCGGSTPLPTDLRVPTFRCTFCGVELATATYAGRAAVSADALIGHVSAAVAQPAGAAAAASAPRFEGGDRSTRAASCRRCGGGVEVPLDLRVHELTCESCGQTQPVRDYISDKERFALDMARQVAGNQALLRLQAEGVPCGRCGGKNAVPDDGSVQVQCRFCSAPILLSDHVDDTAIARQRLKHGMYELRDELRRSQERRQRHTTRVILVLVGLIVVGVLLVVVLGGR
jgi:hypothetical protein